MVTAMIMTAAATALISSSLHVATRLTRPALLPRGPLRLEAESPSELGPDECYLFDTEEGRKYVCTSSPEELAWFMGLDMRDLKSGVKPDDLELIECFEDWSHNGTPQWTCSEGLQKEPVEDDEGGCEIIGESVDEIWFKCTDDDGPGGEGVECESADDFGNAAGALPQEGEVLCKQKKPTEAAL